MDTFEKATKQEFEAVAPTVGGRGNRSPLRKKLDTLTVDEVLRIRNHDHTAVKDAARALCTTVGRVKNTSSRAGIKVSVRHDGDDLLVMRVS